MAIRRKSVAAFLIAIATLLTVATIASAQDSDEPTIEALLLVDSFTSTVIDDYNPLLSGTLIDTAATPIDNYSIEAIAIGDTESVLFTVNGHDARLETEAPYTLDISTLDGPVIIGAQAFDTNNRTGTATAKSTVALNLGSNDSIDVIRVNNIPTRDGGANLDAASIEATDPAGAPVWIYLDTSSLYNSVEWWIDEPPDDRQTLTGQTSTNTSPYHLGGTTNDGPQAHDLGYLTTGTHSITATGLYADGQPITTTAWFTYIAAGDQLDFSETEAPAVPTPAPYNPPAPRDTVPPITLPPAPTTTEPSLLEGSPVEPPRILIPPDFLQPDVIDAELVTVFEYPRQAHLITTTVDGTLRQTVDLVCMDTVIGTFGPPALLYDPELDLRDVEESVVQSDCETIIDIIDQHVTFPRFITTTRNNTPARYWLLDIATPADGTSATSHKYVIDAECVDQLENFDGVTFTDKKWRTVTELPTIRNLDCETASKKAHSLRATADITAEPDEEPELPEPPNPKPPQAPKHHHHNDRCRNAQQLMTLTPQQCWKRDSTSVQIDLAALNSILQAVNENDRPNDLKLALGRSILLPPSRAATIAKHLTLNTPTWTEELSTPNDTAPTSADHQASFLARCARWLRDAAITNEPVHCIPGNGPFQIRIDDDDEPKTVSDDVDISVDLRDPATTPEPTANPPAVNSLATYAKDLSPNEHVWIVRMFNGFLTATYDLAQTDAERAALIADPPALTDSKQFDGLVAAVAQYAATQSKIAVPAWTQETARAGSQDLYFPMNQNRPRHHERVTNTTPAAFAERNVFVTQDDIGTIKPVARKDDPLEDQL